MARVSEVAKTLTQNFAAAVIEAERAQDAGIQDAILRMREARTKRDESLQWVEDQQRQAGEIIASALKVRAEAERVFADAERENDNILEGLMSARPDRRKRIAQS